MEGEALVRRFRARTRVPAECAAVDAEQAAALGEGSDSASASGAAPAPSLALLPPPWRRAPPPARDAFPLAPPAPDRSLRVALPCPLALPASRLALAAPQDCGALGALLSRYAQAAGARSGCMYTDSCSARRRSILSTFVALVVEGGSSLGSASASVSGSSGSVSGSSGSVSGSSGSVSGSSGSVSGSSSSYSSASGKGAPSAAAAARAPAAPARRGPALVVTTAALLPARAKELSGWSGGRLRVLAQSGEARGRRGEAEGGMLFVRDDFRSAPVGLAWGAPGGGEARGRGGAKGSGMGETMRLVAREAEQPALSGGGGAGAFLPAYGFDVLLATPEALHADEALLTRVAWEVVAVDEGVRHVGGSKGSAWLGGVGSARSDAGASAFLVFSSIVPAVERAVRHAPSQQRCGAAAERLLAAPEHALLHLLCPPAFPLAVPASTSSSRGRVRGGGSEALPVLPLASYAELPGALRRAVLALFQAGHAQGWPSAGGGAAAGAGAAPCPPVAAPCLGTNLAQLFAAHRARLLQKPDSEGGAAAAAGAVEAAASTLALGLSTAPWPSRCAPTRPGSYSATLRR